MGTPASPIVPGSHGVGFQGGEAEFGTPSIATPPFQPGGGTPDPSAQVQSMTQRIMQALAQASQRKQFAGQPVHSAVPGQVDPAEARSIGMNTKNPHAWGAQRFMAGLQNSIQNAVSKQKESQLLKAEGDWTYLQSSLNELYAAEASKDPQAIKQAQAKVDVVMSDPKKLKNMAKALNQDWLNPEKTTVYGEALKKVNAKTQETDAKKQQAATGIKAMFQKLLQRQQQPQLTQEQNVAAGREVQAKAPTTTGGADIKDQLEILKLQEKSLHDRAEEARAAKQDDAMNAYRKAELEIQKSRLGQEDKNRQATQDIQNRSLEERIRHNKETEKNRDKALTSLAGADPATAALVKKIANYEINPQSLSTKGGHRESLLGMVAQYDPTYDQTQYGARTAVKKDFNSGQAARNIRSLNTAIGHLNNLKTAADELKNAGFQLWNKIANSTLTGAGDPRTTKFNVAANSVESEVASLFKGTGATDQEIKAWREQLSSAQSPAQLHTAIDTLLSLMASRMQALDSQYKAGMGKPKDFEMLNKESKAILKKLGGEAGKMLELDVADAATGGGGAVSKGPKVGDVVDGYTFKGGDPGKKESWTKP